MQDYFLTGRAALADAVALIDEFGDDAPLAAAMRAAKCRDVENVGRFCHWRQIERFTAALADPKVRGRLQ
jgi:hypothetical protein